MPASNVTARPWTTPCICLVIAALVWLVFKQTVRFGFVNYDDPSNVLALPRGATGLTVTGIVWAFTHTQVGRWAPLTAISHIADCQFYGTWAGGHHLTNVILHAVSAILLFLVMRGMTNAPWRSAFMAAVFAVHPLHVEPVAWISARGDVLSALFFMLTLGVYCRFVHRNRCFPDYALVILCFALGLLAKSTLVTTPLVLLLLDYWPLNRIAGATDLKTFRSIMGKLVIEKIPLFVLSAASSASTIFAQQNAFGKIGRLPFTYRVEEAVLSYVIYLRQTIWPVPLSVVYPRPTANPPLWEVAAALLLLFAISAVVFVTRKKYPCFIVGWLWYLIMLAPMAGFLEIFTFSHADRYTYLPQIGLWMIPAWLFPNMLSKWRYQVPAQAVVAALIMALFTWLAWAQTSFWRNSETLWTHALACTTGNNVAHSNLASALLDSGRTNEALWHSQQALVIKADDPEAHNNLGVAMLQSGGNMNAAIAHFQQAVSIKPNYVDARSNLGNALLQCSRVDEAVTQFSKALELQPDDPANHYNLGNAFAKKGRLDEAIASYDSAIAINSRYMEAQYNLANVLLQKGEAGSAILHYKEAIKIEPDFVDAYRNLGNAFLREGRKGDAQTAYEKAMQLSAKSRESHPPLRSGTSGNISP